MPDSPHTGNQDRIDAAIAHLTQGFAAFSVWSTTVDGTCKCVKGVDCTSPGKHPIPRNGFKAASTDPATVKAMLGAGSNPNYGLVAPEGSDIITMDVDGADWKAKIGDLIAKYGPLPATKTTRTPSGGLHLFYRWPEGVDMPDGDEFHGFVTRFPWRGYVVGPGSAINGSVYAQTGPTEEIATLPLAWTSIAGNPAKPLIVVGADKPGYEMPLTVETGHRHDEILKLVASLWNKRVDKAVIAGGVKELAKRFVDPMDDQRLQYEIDEAYRTAEKKWVEPEGGTHQGTTSTYVPPLQTQDGVFIDPLAIESRIERPDPIDFHQLPVPTGLVLILDHLNLLTDAPHSSLALASMVTMSALVGPSPSLYWRGKHRCALFGCLVGHSGVGRKGAAMREVERAFLQVDPLLGDIQVSGLASGEVLVDILNESKTNTLGTSLIWEHEIGNVLILASREGNIMSGNLRRAWDGDTVQSRSRAKGKTSASGYNVAFMGGVTPGELSRRLTADEVGNGWANRFLWFWSEKRADRYDPVRDGTLDIGTRQYISECIDFGRALGGGSHLIKPLYTMRLTPDAQTRMEVLAESLDVTPIGAIGALRQRMPAHVIRLAMVAALFDQSAEVDIDHVTFAEALAQYAVESMRPVFGLRIDDPVAMGILDVLGQVPDGWMNTTTLRLATGGKDYARLKTALRVLIAENLVVMETRPAGPSGGRPSVGYRLTSRV